jgi:hypothetical protein
VPCTIVTEESQADYVMTGSSQETGENKWYHTVFGGKDKNESSIALVSVKDKTVVWAGEAGDRSLWWGSLARGGQRKVADRLIGQFKKALINLTISVFGKCAT